ncbi:class IIb bacteriocin, lactobin A/cerein 7B family [Flavobacterium sp. GA093]|uniref:Class IIb bacteriocin, lactobin A/cerein 7B family n=1 Tax=Flavobacterium hydrocarbonoxydans TaxID=2683249 RepID=A0A6I4NVR2_9FLAO|nr:class IIb bacteriocin, lactobin A/cerein 7B family [Flavobacterium hydrocarbonoxydans]MWB96545.1 class IIb bacteriocin, lactobin A/cerein 7B family [Flavobacterium hydrocarbonoxydans]
MKKQNANNKLAFNKVAVAELNDNQLQAVEGGITPGIVIGFAIGLLLSQLEHN